jgi:hypothetical protein
MTSGGQFCELSRNQIEIKSRNSQNKIEKCAEMRIKVHFVRNKGDFLIGRSCLFGYANEIHQSSFVAWRASIDEHHHLLRRGRKKKGKESAKSLKFK